MIRRIIALLALVLAFGFVPIDTPAKAAAFPMSAGVAVGSSDPWDTNRLANYRTMAAAGAQYIRGDVPWAYLQDSGPTQAYRWSSYDPQIADVSTAGLKFVAILHMTPGWANGNRGDYFRPNDLTLLTNYCYQVVKRYLARGVTLYEIGNEQNLPHPGLPNAPSGSAYVRDLLTPCSTGIRRAQTEAGRTVTILFGALAPQYTAGEGTPATTFLTDAYNAGAATKFDVMNWHPYNTEPETNPNMNSVLTQLNNITVQKTGASRKIWATEYGAPTRGPISITEAAQGQLVPRAYNKWFSYSFTGPLFWYSERDLGAPPSNDREDFFGLLRLDGSQKPSYNSFKALFRP